jgi:hypothetical protein
MSIFFTLFAIYHNNVHGKKFKKLIRMRLKKINNIPKEKKKIIYIYNMTTQFPQIIKLENNEYYVADDVYSYDTAYFHGCLKIRNIVDKKKLSDNDYVFGYIKGNEYVKSNKNYAKAKLLLTKEWTQKNVPKMMTIDETKKAELYECPEAPNILELEDCEKFKDENGKILEIEVRGERNENNCYFKLRDFVEQFNMTRLYDIVIDNKSAYKDVQHYKFFSVKNTRKNVKSLIKEIAKKELYLTYLGVLKMLFSSHSPKAELFQNWASKILFVAQMGTVEAKQELAANLLGTDPKAIKQVFSTCDAKTPCIYLLNIGSAKDLLKDDKYSSDSLLCKYGCSDDFPRRINEHEKYYKKEFNTNISVLYFSVIDPKFIFQAESDVTNFVSPFKVNFKDTKELIVIEKNNLKMFNKIFTTIQDSYIGCYKGLSEKVKKLEQEIIDLNIEMNNKMIDNKHKIELLTMSHKQDLLSEKHASQLLVEKHKIELKDKDIEILQMKVALLSK